MFEPGGFTRLANPSTYAWMLLIRATLPLVFLLGKAWDLFKMRERIAQYRHEDLTRSFRADLLGFEIIGLPVSHKYRWSDIRAVEDNFSLILFPLQFNPVDYDARDLQLFLPKRLFASRRETQKVLDQLKALHSMHASVPVGNISALLWPENTVGSFKYQKQDDLETVSEAMRKDQKAVKEMDCSRPSVSGFSYS